MCRFRVERPLGALLVALCLAAMSRGDHGEMTNALTPRRQESGAVLELSETVSRLQAQVAQLQEQRAEDGAILRMLRESLVKEEEGLGVGVRTELVRRFQSQLDALKTDLSALVAAKERQLERSTDVRELRSEVDSVRSEWQKVRLDVRALKDRREEELKRGGGEDRNSRVTIKWLHKSVEELKKEMKELAQAQNVSAALGQRGQLETSLGLLRSDVLALRAQWEEVKVRQDTDGATLDQLRRDAEDGRQHQRETAANGQQFREQLSQFKDELLAATRSNDGSGAASRAGAGQETPAATGAVANDEPKRRNGRTRDKSHDRGNAQRERQNEEDLFAPPTQHRLRHRGKMREELRELKSAVESLDRRQSDFDERLAALRWNQSAAEADVRHVRGRVADLLNATRAKATQQMALERTVERVRNAVKRMERSGDDRDKMVQQLGESATGIDKLHSSTVQLFEALEGLEDEYGKRIDDLHKEVSKFEFRMAKVTSTVDILKEDQGSHYGALKLIRSDANGLRQDIEKNSYKLASLRSQVLRDEAQRLLGSPRGAASADGGGGGGQISAGADSEARRQSAILDLEARLASLNAKFVDHSLRVRQLGDKLDLKADVEHVTHWAASADQLDDKIANLSERVEPIAVKVSRLEQDLRKVYQHFPADCSQIVGPTGVYHIFPPGTGSPVRALCDMDTEQGGWTTVQQRSGGGGVDFNRDWEGYKKGFGQVNPGEDFWIGNEILHQLTADRNVSLRFDLWDEDGRYYYAQYGRVRVLDEASRYRLRVDVEEEEGFRGNASDALQYHRDMKFSTYDEDNDASSLQCAHQYEGGWWYNHCQHVNVNGKYSIGLTWYDTANNVWIQLRRIQMKIKADRRR